MKSKSNFITLNVEAKEGSLLEKIVFEQISKSRETRSSQKKNYQEKTQRQINKIESRL